MLNVQMRFNNGSYQSIEDWIDNGNLKEKQSAVWLVKALAIIEKTGTIDGNCVARKHPVRVWHLHKNPCSILYRDRKPSTSDIILTVDRAMDGNHNWRILGSSVLVEPNGP